jgi:hypothetical protein
MSSSCAAMMSHPLTQTPTMGMPLFWMPGSLLLSLLLLGGAIWLLLHWQFLKQAAPTLSGERQSPFIPYEQGYRPVSPMSPLPERGGELPDTLPESWDEQPQAHYPVLPPHTNG